MSLSSLLRTKDDFDLYVGDNDSRDMTWEYLSSLKDPRIREVKRFERNFGELNVANWALSKRRPGQDFVMMENDCLLRCEEFVGPFDRAFAEIPNLGSVGGWLRSFKVDESRMSGYFYPDTVMGMFTCTKGEVQDKLGYYSEGCYIADVEVNYRIRNLLGMDTGYVKTVDCSVVHPFGHYDCEGCRTRQGVCCRHDVMRLLPGERRPADLERDLYCNRFYPVLNRDFWNEMGEEARRVMSDRIVKGKQVYWDSVHSGGKIPEWQEEKRRRFQGFFESQYARYLSEKGLDGSAR